DRAPGGRGPGAVGSRRPTEPEQSPTPRTETRANSSGPGAPRGCGWGTTATPARGTAPAPGLPAAPAPAHPATPAPRPGRCPPALGAGPATAGCPPPSGTENTNPSPYASHGPH